MTWEVVVLLEELLCFCASYGHHDVSDIQIEM